jgi:DNA polymerase-4
MTEGSPIVRERTVFHVDVNSAYLSWEAAWRLQHGSTLDLRTIPSVVGGDPESRHGIVLTKSIPAKKFGIQTGEVLWQARQKCPNLVVVPPNYSLYMMCHQALLDLLHDFSSDVQVYSIDEAFIEYTGSESVQGDAVATAHRLKDRIRNELGFTVNVGVGPNKLLAKMAGEFSKPDKVHTCWPEEIESKMWPMPVGELFGVGRATTPKLQRLNIMTIGDLANAPDDMLARHLKSYGALLKASAQGQEFSSVGPDFRPPMKGIGNSSTIPFDCDTLQEAKLVLLSLTEMVCMRLRQTGLCARLVSVSIRNSDMNGRGHQHRMDAATDNTFRIYETACRLFGEMWLGPKEKIRNFGVRVSDLSLADYMQMSILQPYDERKKRLDDTLDRIRFRYGTQSVQRAAFLASGIAPVMGGIPEEDFPIMSNIM